MTELRVLSYNARADTEDLARRLRPDIVAVREAPRGLRWRSRCADLARRSGLVYAAGGLPGLGNLILVDLRVRVLDTWHLRFPLTPGRRMRGAALVRCSVGGSTFVVAGSQLSPDPVERATQAQHLAKALAEEDMLVLVADGDERATLAEGRTDAAPFFVDPRISVLRREVADPVVYVDLAVP